MSDICDSTGRPFEWLTGPDKGMYIICGKAPNHKEAEDG